MTTLIKFCRILLLLSVLAAPATAQDATGRIEGTLRDPQGALVPNANIVLTHLATGGEKSVNSGNTGSFNFVLLPIGQYRLVVEAANFARYVREPLTLNVNDVLRLTIDLKIGTSQEVV
ncbi:MAG TPA: carboxypeptidase-like regulatory domain-containing protein, partial [Terriglobia bacterium]|nr:carboxypeptidase-like regulatory domain-containing protein [Terriglobia bacterium]